LVWGGNYCEETIWWPNEIVLGDSRPIVYKADAPKMRNLSRETKMTIREADEDTNPALGKFDQFHNMI